MLAKGQYLKDASGNKVNDPIFDNYAPMPLTREVGKSEIPITSFCAAAASTVVSGASGVMGTSDMSKANAVIAQGQHAGNPAIKMYTAEEAVLQGFIKHQPAKTAYDTAPISAGPGVQDPLPAAITDSLNAVADTNDQSIDVLVKNNEGVSIKDEPRLAPEQAMTIPPRAVAAVAVPAVKLPTLKDVHDMEQSLPVPELNEAAFTWDGTTYDSRSDMMAYLRRHAPDQVQAAAEKYPALNKKKR